MYLFTLLFAFLIRNLWARALTIVFYIQTVTRFGSVGCLLRIPVVLHFSTFGFATYIVQSFFFLKPNDLASSNLQ